MELFYKILNTPSASGMENSLGELLKSEMPDCDSFTDENGSVVIHKKGNGRSMIFAAAMDSPSLFITHTAEDGFARFCANGTDAKGLCGQTVRFCDGTRGIVFSGKDKDNVTDMFIDTFEKQVQEADPAFIDAPLAESPEYITAFDSGRAAILYAMVKAAHEIHARDVYFVFLAKTIGYRHSVSFLEDLPQDAQIVFVDKSVSNDYPGEKEIFIRLGGGVCVRAMDKSVISSRTLFEKAAKLSEKVKIQKEVSDRKNAASALQKAYNGFETLSVGLPARYADRVCETVSKSDLSQLVKFIVYYANEGQVTENGR